MDLPRVLALDMENSGGASRLQHLQNIRVVEVAETSGELRFIGDVLSRLGGLFEKRPFENGIAQHIEDVVPPPLQWEKNLQIPVEVSASVPRGGARRRSSFVGYEAPKTSDQLSREWGERGKENPMHADPGVPVKLDVGAPDDLASARKR
jgi:hypothetical protein